MKKALLLIVVICSFALVSQIAIANGLGLIEITKVENINGSIGVYIQNELSIGLYTNPADRNSSVLKYYIDNEAVSIITNKSASYVAAGKERLIVLNKAWPTEYFYTLNVTFADETGKIYPAETTVLFANPGLSKIDAKLDSFIVTLDKDVVLTVHIKASGENDISSINVDVKNPKYYIFQEKTNPAYLLKDTEADFVFKYKLSGASLPETVISTTSRAVITISYVYLGHDSVLELNESILIFNKNVIGNNLPNVTAWMEIPAEAERGAKANVSIYAHNINVGGHKACDINFSLNSSSSHITIPIWNILPGEELFGTAITPVETIATFTIDVSDNASLADYELTLTTQYRDCEWRATPFKITTTDSFTVVEPIAQEQPTNESEEEANETQDEPAPPVITTTSQEPGLKEVSPAKYYTIIGIVAVGIFVMIAWLLEWRSRFI